MAHSRCSVNTYVKKQRYCDHHMIAIFLFRGLCCCFLFFFLFIWIYKHLCDCFKPLIFTDYSGYGNFSSVSPKTLIFTNGFILHL